MPNIESNNQENQVLTARQNRLLQRLKEARDRLLKAVSDLDETILTTERVAGDWTVKDLIGHIVSWNDEFRLDIEDILRGEHPGSMRLIDKRDEFNQWNQLQVAKKRDWPWQRMLDDLDRDYREAHQLILLLRPQDFRKRGVTPWKSSAQGKPTKLTRENTDSVETLVTYHWRHANDHIGKIERWKKRRVKRKSSA